jgi:hypothetical protein
MPKQYDNLCIPHKKPRGGELTQEPKAGNRALRQSRVVCEQAFAGVKRYGAVSARLIATARRLLMTI